MTLTLFFAGILSLIIIVYVILDGFDLGIGILFPFVKNSGERDIMMNSIAPVWDGNETWLVFGGSILYGAFPLAYSTLLPALYLPIIIMLAALVFRGVAFEFRFKAEKTRAIWDSAFAFGSTLAAFCQGIILGTFVQGYNHLLLNHSAQLSYLTPFSIFTGIAVTLGYALLGATWLIGKTGNHLQDKMFLIAKILLPLIFLFIIVVSLWTPFMSDFIWQRWFRWPNMLYLAPLPIGAFLTAFLAWQGLKKRYERTPFYCSIFIFILCYIGFGISSWPYIVPHQITIWQAASDSASLKFLFIGVSILLPVLIAYSSYAYHVFRGKVSHEGYH